MDQNDCRMPQPATRLCEVSRNEIVATPVTHRRLSCRLFQLPDYQRTRIFGKWLFEQQPSRTLSISRMAHFLHFSSCNPWPSIAMKRLFKDSANVGCAKMPSRITV